MKLLPMLTGIALLATACASGSEDEPMASSGEASTAPAEEASTTQAGQIN
jgi:PBP1b-binding outer membrane lipoprotein LpoB